MGKYIIFGYGGLGAAIAQRLSERGDEVTCVSRVDHEAEGLKFIRVNLLEEGAQSVLETIFSQQHFDVVINTIGMLHDSQHQPEKALSQFADAFLLKSVQVNVLPTTYIAKALNNALSKNTSIKLMTFSARLSSIHDNLLGGWYSYRMSKAMLNMFVKNLSIEWGRRFPKVVVVAYHPGTVKTPLSEPFLHTATAVNVLTPLEAADHCLSVLDNVSIDDTGKLFDWRGDVIEF